jgi:hypothetical protein
MSILKSGTGLVFAFGVALLTLGAINTPGRSDFAAPPPVRPTVAVPSQQTNQAQPDWTLQIDSPTLTQDLNAWAAGQATVQTPVGMARLQQLNADIRDNELVVTGTADAGWISAPVDVAAKAEAQSGRVQVQVTQAHVSGVDVPEVGRRQLEQQLQSQIEQSLGAYGVAVRSVQMGGGKLVLSGTRQ